MIDNSTKKTSLGESTCRAKILRSACAIATMMAFVCSPLAAIAQQAAPGASDDAGEAKQAEEAAPAPKPAGPTPTMFLLPTQGIKGEMSEIIPERIGEMLRAQLADKRSAKLLPTYEAMMQQGGGNPNAELAEAERLYTSGIGLLTAGQNDRAATTFQRSVDSLEKNLADLENFNVLVDAYRNMALAYFLAGFDFDARKKMQVYANLRPNEKLDPEKFPKELREVYQVEADKVKKAGPGKISVTAGGEKATVFVDGVEKGQAPVELNDIGYGYHYLVVRGATGGVWSEQIRVRGRSKEQTFEAKLGAPGATPDAAASNQPAFYTGLVSSVGSGKFSDEQLRPYLDELHSRTGAKYMAWVVMVKKRSSYSAVPFIYNVETSELVREGDVSFTLALSNLRVGVNTLANSISGVVGAEAGDKLVTSVDLKPAPAAVVVKPAAGEADKKPSTQAPAETKPVAQAPVEQSKSVKPLPPIEDGLDEDDDSNVWMWVGAGSAAVLVAGAVVGGVLLFADDGDPAGGGKFDAALSW